MKNFLLNLFFSCLVLGGMMTSSCMVHKHSINGGISQSSAKVYDKKHQWYLMGGAVALGQNQPAYPEDGSYQIKTYTNLTDAGITAITGGILTRRTIKVLVNR